ncbi:threonine ammonia-lyase [Salinibacillus xinjiangensis]|uniref:threonine ammonia-lyase n=1 Tax=Salinibacillus xinjiangensis TaxID=1229268 RepID=A0A6G1XB37_9BACI|nr:threonine/serine dehydratase [Salinibacillus xinjiangensis]MRG88116.1 pyridoxal-phosphate dependent enzyme [Salinibacillus xinjiangensis]
MIIVHDILQARENIAKYIHKTPILHSSQLSEICGNEMYFKSEHLQKTGSFKIRGATNKVLQAVQREATYITAASSGNHGQAVAYIANQLGVPATIVVPVDAKESKLNAIKAYGGQIEKCGTTSAERLPRAKKLATEHNGWFIPPYDDPLIMAGQGTIGLEILEQLDHVDVVVVPIGGGGLISGILTAIKQTKPKVKVIGVEPETANDTYLSLKNKKITAIPGTTTIADGLRTSQPGSMTFPVLQKFLDDLVLVSEEEIKRAQFLVMERMKQLIEPSSAVTVAAAMNGKLGVQNKNVVCVLSGGNVDIGK